MELEADATDAADSAEVVSKTLAQTPPPTHAGGQDDGSYTNSLKLCISKIKVCGGGVDLDNQDQVA